MNSPRVPHPKVIELLAVTLGEAKATAAWDEALKGLGVQPSESYSAPQIDALLHVLSNASPGIAVAARLARARLEADEGDESPASHRTPSRRDSRRVSPSGSSHPPDGPRSRGRETVDLVPFLAPSLGEDKAVETIHHYARLLNLPPGGLTREDAVQILDAMSQASGLLGVVARFAKVRFLLRSSGPPPER